MNENERIKQEQDGLDVYQSLLRYAVTGFDSIHPDDFVRLRWFGLYQQKPNVGHFMLRIKVPSGVLTSSQLRVVADVTKEYGRGICDITTRQNFQFHWLEIGNLPDILARFEAVGISTAGACGDIVRNVTGCPVAGIDCDEIFDARPWATLAHEHFLTNKTFSNLPRKFKVSIAGCKHLCAQPEINDLSAVGVQRVLANGEVENGFQVRVGGGLSARPFFAKKLNMFVKPEQLIEVMEGVVGIFRDFGNRENRKKARIKFLVDEWGIEKFEAELRTRLSFTPEGAVEWPDPLRVFRDHVGVHPQRQEGYSYVGAAILTGRMNDTQVFEIARLAEEYGDGTVRTTNQQNLVFSNVRNENVAALVEALAAVGIYTQASAIRRAAVACTGNEFCNLALTETKNLLIDIVQHLDRTVVIDEPIRINLNGCPNSCGQHHIGDIGLQGCLVKMGPGETVDGYDVSLGGRLGRDSKFVRPIWRKVPATNVKFAIENLLNGYQEVKEPDEDFSTFVDRHSDEELANLMKTAFAEGAEVAVAA